MRYPPKPGVQFARKLAGVLFGGSPLDCERCYLATSAAPRGRGIGSYMKRLAIAIGFAFALTHTAAHAWFFFFLPSSVTDKITGSEGDHCVASTASVGDRIVAPGGSVGTIKSLSGTSMRCTDSQRPIRAMLDFSAPPIPLYAPAPVASAHMQTEGYRCMASETKVGDDFYGESGTRGLVKSLTKKSTACGPLTSTQAYVIFDATAATKLEIEELANAAATPPVANSIPSSSATPYDPKSATERLRVLGKLLEDGLITQEDYNAKKREILSAL
jgi:hypothetical protein